MYAPKSSVLAPHRPRDLAGYRALYEKSLGDPTAFWAEQARRLTWRREPREIMTADLETAEFGWYQGGVLNVAENCVDRHVATRGDKAALVWVADEPGRYVSVTYRELRREVCRAANMLRALGVKKGDRVCLYLPMIPECVYAMLACARIGAVHSVVFAGFSAQALRERIVDAGCEVVITANEGRRGGRSLPLKHTVDEAVAGLDLVRAVVVVDRTDAVVAMEPGRDYAWREVVGRERPVSPVEPMDAEDPLFVLYTSGSTGRPKGVLHTTGGYLVYAAMTHEYVFDLREDDVYLCAADVGWITGHSYVVYGPLCNGATTVLFESTPLHPDASRYWQVVDDLGVTVFYTSPTALRAVAREGNEAVRKHRRTSLRVLGTVGEPINPEVWEWYHQVVGEGRCDVVDTYWQTETGGILISPLAGITPCKPGSATLPFFGVKPVIMDQDGKPTDALGVSGQLCMGVAWPGQARTVYGDHERFVRTYFSQFPGYYFTGDGCRRDEEGYYFITGRVDDVLNVAGHRLGTAEIESALVAHESVAEAAVVGVPHEIKGTGVFAFVQRKPGFEDVPAEQAETLLREQVRRVIGPIATPDDVLIVTGLPKTRSGKIMRRILRKIASGEDGDLGDVSTLADPGVVSLIVEAYQARSARRG